MVIQEFFLGSPRKGGRDQVKWKKSCTLEDEKKPFSWRSNRKFEVKQMDDIFERIQKMNKKQAAVFESNHSPGIQITNHHENKKIPNRILRSI